MKRINAGKVSVYVLALFIFFTLSKSTFAAVSIVKDGEPVSVIVLSRKPSPVAFEAAYELQRVIERISGATLPIFLENEWNADEGWDTLKGPRSSMTRIFVGDSATAREAGLDMSGLKPEGFLIKHNPSFCPTEKSFPPAPMNLVSIRELLTSHDF